jgi:hypothetical protein
MVSLGPGKYRPEGRLMGCTVTRGAKGQSERIGNEDRERGLGVPPDRGRLTGVFTPELRHVDAQRNEVEEINLRTYASAEWAIYGQSPGVVQRVRAQAKREKLRVGQFEPVPPTIHIYEQTEGEPGKVQRLRPKGEVKRRQRWPRWED